MHAAQLMLLGRGIAIACFVAFALGTGIALRAGNYAFTLIGAVLWLVTGWAMSFTGHELARLKRNTGA